MNLLNSNDPESLFEFFKNIVIFLFVGYAMFFLFFYGLMMMVLLFGGI